MYSRRHVLQGGAALSLGGLLHGGIAWGREDNPVRAIMPSASHDTLAVKVLLDRPPSGLPRLSIGRHAVTAQKMDPDGYAWGFVQPGLAAGKGYTLTLSDEYGAALRPPWKLRTLPPPDAEPDHFRILFFTCAGGDDGALAGGILSNAARRALFDRALSFAPDLAVANGDHIYWDQWMSLSYRRDPAARAATEAQYRKIAWIDEDSAFDSETNRRALNTIVGRQIAATYEDRFASTPLIFVVDDHDYFENDNAGEFGYTFPPRPFVFNLQQRTADMVYPFALGRPDLGNPYRSGTVEAVRIGKLLELNLFDCRRGWSTGPDARMIFPEVEAFLLDRLRRSTARQLIHVPSLPFAWAAGKLGEWYDDGPSEQSIIQNDKSYWQAGWFEQHQRLVAGLTAQKTRAAVSISGDMHASAISRIMRSGDIDLSANPVEAILPGTVGTGKLGFPSAARGIAPFHPATADILDIAKMQERNGFSIVDVRRDTIEVRQFVWRPPEPIEAIQNLQPSNSYTIAR